MAGAEPAGPARSTLFGFEPEQLMPVVEAAAGGGVASFDVAFRHELRGHRGYGSEKAVPTFCYVGTDGSRGEVTALVKRTQEADRREARSYAELARLGAPVPRLYGALTDGAGCEVVFVEYLHATDDVLPFGRFLADPEALAGMVTAAARLNALRPGPAYGESLGSLDVAARVLAAQDVLADLWCRAGTGDLGPELAELCETERDAVPSLQRLARETAAAISPMQRALCHCDLYPDSVARRPGTGEWLLTDLESIGFAPRFFDVGRWIGPPDEAVPHAIPRRELADAYLQALSRAGGPRVPRAVLLGEARQLWLGDMLMMMGFALRRSVDGVVDWTDDRDEGRSAYRAQLLCDVRALLRQVA